MPPTNGPLNNYKINLEIKFKKKIKKIENTKLQNKKTKGESF